MNCVRIAGRVFSGIGEGRIYVELYRSEIEKVLGIKPYPGTLNVKLEHEYVDIVKRLLVPNPHAVIKPPKEGLAPVLAWRAYVKDLVVYIVKPVKTVWRFDVIELVAEKNLRELFGLADGDTIEVLVPLAQDLKC
uniref:Riboflavin kinase n=1 Tax=Ignisphaera aggregans TaxID=334771 RepID=A0A7J3Z7X4_9CREN